MEIKKQRENCCCPKLNDWNRVFQRPNTSKGTEPLNIDFNLVIICKRGTKPRFHVNVHNWKIEREAWGEKEEVLSMYRIQRYFAIALFVPLQPLIRTIVPYIDKFSSFFTLIFISLQNKICVLDSLKEVLLEICLCKWLISISIRRLLLNGCLYR